MHARRTDAPRFSRAAGMRARAANASRRREPNADRPLQAHEQAQARDTEPSPRVLWPTAPRLPADPPRCRLPSPAPTVGPPPNARTRDPAARHLPDVVFSYPSHLCRRRWRSRDPSESAQVLPPPRTARRAPAPGGARPARGLESAPRPLLHPLLRWAGRDVLRRGATRSALGGPTEE